MECYLGVKKNVTILLCINIEKINILLSEKSKKYIYNINLLV
jgi:hypothetical protein